MLRKNLDPIDKRLLRRLQRDATEHLDDLANEAGLSPTACWRRIKRLEDEGLIARRVALLDQDVLGLKLTGYVMIRTGNHSDEWLQRFAAHVSAMPEVVEFHRMTGEVDYLLKVVAKDLQAYDAIYKRIIQAAKLKDVSATFSMERIKGTTELPLDD